MGVAETIAIPRSIKLHHKKEHEAPHADPDDIVITMSDRVIWEYSEDFLVVFEKETPFDRWYFYPGNNISSTPRPDVKHNHKYKYSVHVNGAKRDPNIIIRP
jgi:hypothetical protein